MFVGFEAERDRLTALSVTSATDGAYSRCTRRYEEFCLSTGLDAWSSLPGSMELWAASLGKQGLMVGTIQSHLSAVRHYARRRGCRAPTDSDRLQLVLQGIRREQGKRPSTKKPVCVRHLRRLASASSILGEGALRFSAMILVAFYGFLRPSEFLVTASLHYLRRSSVRFGRTSQKCSLKLTSYKHSDGAATVTIREFDARALDPIRTLREYIDRVPGPPDGPLFDCSAEDFRADLDRVVQHAGISTKLTPHSFRHGGATWASHRGWPDARIRAHGRWKSDAYRVYVQRQ